MKLFVMLLLLLPSFMGNTQDNTVIDSLKNGINNNIHDSIKIEFLCELHNEYYDLDSSLKYCKKELNYRLKLKKDVVLGYIHIMQILSSKRKTAADSTILYGKKAIKEIKKNSLIDTSDLLYVKLLIANSCLNYRDKNDGIKILNEIIDIASVNSKFLSKELIAKISLSQVYINADANYEKAMNILLEAINRAEKHKDKINNPAILSNLYGTLGDCFGSQGKYEKAIFYIQKAIYLLHQDNNLRGEAMFKLKLAELFIANNNLDKALLQLDSSMNLYKKLKIDLRLARSYQLKGDIFNKKNNLNRALDFYRKSLEFATEMNNLILEVNLMISISEIYLKTGREENRVKQFLDKSLMICQKQKYKRSLLTVYKLYVDYNKKKENFKKAFYWKENYMELKDSLFNEEKSLQITEMETKYETEKKDKEISELASQNEIASLSLKNKTLALRQRNYMLFGLGGLLFLLGIVGYLFYQQNKIKNEQQTAQLEQKLLRTQMNPHFMSNALMSIQTYMYDNNTKDAALYLGKFGKLTRQILDASRQDYILLEDEVTFIKNYLDFQQLMFPNKLDYKVNIDKSVEDEEELMIPPMLSQPFIENAIEHGIRHLQNKKGNILITFKQQNDNLILEIEDDGVGRKQAHNINEQIKSNHTSHSTNITQERIELYKKKYKKHISFNIFDKEIGTKVRFEIPFIYG